VCTGSFGWYELSLKEVRVMATGRVEQVSVRHDLRPGDLGRVTAQHGVLYAAEYGFDHTFEAYVAESLAEFGKAAPSPRDRLWIAEADGRLVGSIGIVGRAGNAAQLRWLLVAPEARGLGLGRQLVKDALAFCRETGSASVFLWTVSVLIDAARIYGDVGFQITEEHERTMWGTTVTEQRYDLVLHLKERD
jgi:GNAT superfamily N-acetyltransferase